MTKQTDPNYLYIPYSGPNLLETPLLNKGSAFSQSERENFNLNGLLPPRFETIEEQVERCYQQYSSFKDNLNKHIYLRAIQDNNETLYYRLVRDHLEEMMPIIYTPTVGDACEKFSDIYRSSRGLFISYEERHNIDDILRNATKGKVKVIVVTDGERILGLGDQGIGGMGIPIGKLSLYTVCGGISPAYTLPVMLDVGTNNEKLLNDPMYMGERHKRVSQESYDSFVEKFIVAAQKRWPGVLIQFEDCTVTYNDEVLFKPEYGTFDLAVGSSIVSSYAGSADFRSFDNLHHVSDTKTIKIEKDSRTLELENLYKEVRDMRADNSYSDTKIETIFNTLKNNHTEDWLLTLELYELALQHNYLIQSNILERLQELKCNKSYTKLIENGLVLCRN